MLLRLKNIQHLLSLNRVRPTKENGDFTTALGGTADVKKEKGVHCKSPNVGCICDVNFYACLGILHYFKYRLASS